MALEQICGMDKMTFLQAYSDDNVAFAQLEDNKARNVFNNPHTLLAPPFPNPEKRINQLLSRSQMKLEATHGTTTLGFKYKGGILLCADSRGTSGGFIASQEMKKVVEVDPGILSTIAGGAGDCVYWDRVLTMECRLHALTYGKRMPVTSAARIMCNIANQFKGLGLCMGLILAGYDVDGSKLIYVDSDGQRTEGEQFATGSGIFYALSIMDAFHKWDMSDEEAYNLALRGVYHAISLDPHSGGLVRLYHITEQGWSLVTVKDYMELAKIFKDAREIDCHVDMSGILTKGFRMDPNPTEQPQPIQCDKDCGNEEEEKPE